MPTKKIEKKSAKAEPKALAKKAPAKKAPAKEVKKAVSAPAPAKKPVPAKAAKPLVKKQAEPVKGATKTAGKAPADAVGGEPKKILIAVSLAPKKPAVSVTAPGVMIKKPEAPVAKVQVKREDEKAEKLNAKETKDIREQLMAKREAILSDIRSEVGDKEEPNSAVKPDEADMATDFYESAVSYEMAMSGHKALEEIETALKKIDQGTYGLCECCEAPIPKSRLKVLPFATYCAHCKGDRERSGGGEGDDDIWGFLDSDTEEESTEEE